MKTIILIISVVSMFSFNGYSQTTKTSDLLKDKETRNETFNAILNNHELMMDFMDAMKAEDIKTMDNMPMMQKQNDEKSNLHNH
ncbi:MAG: hypothetical protein JJE45_07535 [Prolixibacteraceae bacterium]|nr:hypothetical protein [Prolixibacteraceae bacterium]